jgi:hypothetical protein
VVVHVKIVEPVLLLMPAVGAIVLIVMAIAVVEEQPFVPVPVTL